jgi:pimeloyl-ACP methyl ester carboxylesterase
LPYITAHVAAQSFVPVDGGWRASFDRRIYLRPSVGPDDLPMIDARALFVRAEQGALTPQAARDMAARIRGPVDVVLVPGSGHHIMFDQPEFVRELLLERLAAWA